MKRYYYYLLLLLINQISFAQQTVTISGTSSVEVGIPYNFTFQFNPSYPTNNTTGIKADAYVITEWVVTTGTNNRSNIIPGYINSPNNQSYYYNDSSFNSPNPKTVPIQWGDGADNTTDYIEVKVSGYYKYSLTNEIIGYFNYLKGTKEITIQRINSPIIKGNSEIASCSQNNQTYSFSNTTNSDKILWTVSSGTIVGSATGKSITVQPPLIGNFYVNCKVSRSSSNPNYSKNSSILIKRLPYASNAKISAPIAVCPNSQTICYINDLEPNTNVTWSCSATSLANLSSPINNQITVSTNSYEGQFDIIATLTNSCGEKTQKTHSILIGKPVFENFSFENGNQSICIAPFTNFTYSVSELNSADRIIANFKGLNSSEIITNTNFEWKTLNDNILLNIPKGNKISICTLSAGYTSISVRAKNSCGWSEWFELPIEITENTNSFRISSNQSFNVYPIPTSDFINIEETSFSKNNGDNRSLKIIEIYNMYGLLIKKFIYKDTKITIPTNELKKGNYILKINNSTISERHNIVIQ